MSEAWKQWEGRSVDNRFPLRQFLGASSHSAVFLTESAGRGGTKAAIKLVAAGGAAAEEQIARWREIARLSHPNLQPLYHYGRTRLNDLDLVFAVMEYADETLAEILPSRPLTAEEARQMLQPVLDALMFLHQRGLVHGDIQPSNILAVGETIKLSSDTVRSVQSSGKAVGQRSSLDARPAAAGSVEPAGDIYSLGVTLTQALTQRSPFDSGASLGHASEPLQPPFDDIVLHALHPDPQLRWTAADIGIRLNPAASAATATATGTKTPAVASPKPVNATPAVPTAAPPKVAPSTKPRVPKSSAPPARPKVPQNVVPTSVPLSPVAPLPKASAGPGSLLRYAVVIGVAAILLFAAVRGFRRTGSTDQAAASSAEKPAAPSPSTREAATAQPAARKADSKAETKADKRPARAAATEPVTQPPAPAPASTKPGSQSATTVEAKSTTPVPFEPAPSSATSEVAPATGGPASTDVSQQVLPTASQKALATIQGKVRVTVNVQVDAAGNVGDAQLESPSGSTYFNDLALKAAQQWQFQPNATGDVRSYRVRFEFTLAGPKAFASRLP